MKVVVCNYRYFVSGGPERYMLSLMDLLSNKGHQPIPFSVGYNDNIETEYSKYFVKPPADPSQVYYKELQLNALQKLRLARNAVYSNSAKRDLENLINDHKPDIVQTLQIHTVMSYSVIDAVKNCGLPVISRLSNYQLICPSENFIRDHKVCEECSKSLFNAIKYKCVQNSLQASTLRTASLWFHRVRKTFAKVDKFIVPSHFLQKKMIQNGFSEDKIDYVPSFIHASQFKPSYESDNYIVCVGRIAIEKGAHILLKAYDKVKSNTKLLMIGNYDGPESQEVLDLINGCKLKNVELLGYKPLSEIKDILKNAMFTICPTICYDNSPNSIYESFAMGKPIIASRIGSIPEQIREGQTGLLFEAGNCEDLAEKIDYLVENKSKLKDMGKESRKYVEEKHSSEVHYKKLMEIYDIVLN